ncbi:MAG: DUF4230 domain-containing protein [Bacteroidales bacterium]|nr:DUF4230 domain-containing protein [Bacteroidales bacterium]MCF8458436.1 DUF4230 domain-containing protein [Bacteroidales bacterium]
MLKFFAKYGKILINVIVVAAIVVAVFMINPWNLFGDGLNLKPTANNVSAIRKIGQLITAEYYGETIATFDQSELRLLDEDDINARADLIFRKLKQDVLYAHAKSLLEETSDEKSGFFKFKWLRWASNPKKDFSKHMDSVIIKNKDILYDSLSKGVIEFYLKGSSNIKKRKINKIEQRDINDALWLLMQEVKSKTEGLSDKDFDAYIQEGLPMFDNQVFSDFYYEKKRDENKKELKKELAIIGRGWVKAGIDFGTLDENNLMFDKEQGIVHLFGVHAEILNADINPWFIPEKKIPGFQIIEANRRVDFNDAKKVKSYCVEKLRKMAIDAGILEQAERQAKESLKSFISLVSGFEVNEVYFHYDKFSVLSQEFVSDEYISFEEARMLDTLIAHQIDTIIKLGDQKKNYTANQRLKQVKISQLKMAIERFKKCQYEGQPTGYDRNEWSESGYNRLAYLVYKITADSVMTSEEFKEIKSQRWDLDTILNLNRADKPDGKKRFIEKEIWYTDPLDFINEYNCAIDEIRDQIFVFGDFDTISYDSTEWASKKDSFLRTSIFNIKYNNNLVFVKWVSKEYSKAILSNTKYPLKISENWKEKIKDEEKFSVEDLTDSTLKVKLGNQVLSDISSYSSLDSLKISTRFIVGQKQNDTTKLDTIIFTAKKKDASWEIDSLTSQNKEIRAYLKYIVNYYETEEKGWTFAKASQGLRNFMNPDSLNQKTGKWIERVKSKFTP